jgi:alpha-methylacyl-CoA racemase
MAGHDINYIALGGALYPVGRRGEAPTPPLNLVGDFGGGGMLLAFGMVCGIVEARTSGRGQVVDAAMVDGAAVLMTFFHALRNGGMWSDERGANMLDSGSHFYDAYECADGKYISLGSIEPQFYAEMCEKLGIPADELPQHDRSRWPELKERVASAVRTKTRAEWCEIMDGSDVCYSPVLALGEVAQHPHNVHRQTFTDVAGVVQPSPAPRFSRTPGAISRPPSHPGQHTDEVLAEWGFARDEIAKLRETGAFA